jgi:hypothetical protein
MSENPVDRLQLEQLVVKWVPLTAVHPNTYNPNRMETPNHELLRRSILEDGWTQPIVCLPDGMIIDGEQRWTVAQLPLDPAYVRNIIADLEERQNHGVMESPAIIARLKGAADRLDAVIRSGQVGTIASLTNGTVPITEVPIFDEGHQMISTIRHNRACGTHELMRVAAITQDLVRLGLNMNDLKNRLGFDRDEAQRLLDSSAGMVAHLKATLPEGYGNAWKMVAISDLPAQEVDALPVDPTFKERIETYREDPGAFSYAPAPIKLKFIVTPDQMVLVYQALAPDVPAGLITLLRVAEKYPNAAPNQ